MTQLLCGAGANPDLSRDVKERPLLVAIQGGHSSIAKMLLSVGASSQFSLPQESPTLCQLATSTGLNDVAELLKRTNRS